MQQPLVSIAVFTYNQINFIEETLKSALVQDYDNLEIVVADDGSTDGTDKIILDYAKKYPAKLVPIVNVPNVGITGNLNRVLKACKGEYIAWLAGDDIFLPGKIKKQMEWFQANPGGAICYCDSDIFDSDTGKTLMIYRNKNYYKGKSAWHLASEYNMPPTSAFIVNQKLCKDIIFDYRTPVISDWLYVIEVCMRGKVGYVDGTYLRYRRHTNSTTGGGASKAYLDDRLIYTDLLISKYPDYFLPFKKQRAMIFYTTALREFLDGNYKEARVKLLCSLSEWPFLLRAYILLMGCLIRKPALGFALKYKSLINKIIKNH